MNIALGLNAREIYPAGPAAPLGERVVLDYGTRMGARSSVPMSWATHPPASAAGASSDCPAGGGHA